jgi:hypothetical protein
VKKSLIAIASAIAVTCASAAFAATPAPSADPAVVAAAKQMMASMKMRDVTLASLKEAERQMPAQLMATMNAAADADVTMTAAQKAEMHKKLEQMLPTLTAQIHAMLSDPALADEILAETVPLYAEFFTLDEIRQLSAFYASPLGQKMLANVPRLMSRNMEISNRVMMPRMMRVLAEIEKSIVGK